MTSLKSDSFTFTECKKTVTAFSLLLTVQFSAISQSFAYKQSAHIIEHLQFFLFVDIVF